MSPLFGRSDKPENPSGSGDTQGEIARLRSLPLEQLASEVIARGFPPADTPDRGRASVHDMAQLMVPDILRTPQDTIWEVEELIGEGVQLLQRAGLAQCNIVGADRRLQWVLTRRGHQAVAERSVAEALANLA